MNRPRATEENIDDLIDEWHESDTEEPLHEFLGLTLAEYYIYASMGVLLEEEK